MAPGTLASSIPVWPPRARHVPLDTHTHTHSHSHTHSHNYRSRNVRRYDHVYMVDRILVRLISERYSLSAMHMVRGAHSLACIGHADLMTDSVYDMIVATCHQNMQQLEANELADLLWALGRQQRQLGAGLQLPQDFLQYAIRMVHYQVR